jgi:hypothetical protein
VANDHVLQRGGVGSIPEEAPFFQGSNIFVFVDTRVSLPLVVVLEGNKTNFEKHTMIVFRINNFYFSWEISKERFV